MFQPNALAAYPHICERIRTTWGSAECLNYLRSLLVPKDRLGLDLADLEQRAVDRRTGAGFPLPVLHELLHLIEAHPPHPVESHHVHEMSVHQFLQTYKTDTCEQLAF